jgi:hypothetical protein
MKLVELILDEDGEIAGIQAVSLVKFPATEENWMYFNSDTPYVMAKVQEDKQMLIGPALVPHKKILRMDDITGEQYEVFFSPETVRQAAELYMKDERTNQHTYEHEIEVSDVTVVESWIIEDETHDKASLYGFKLPVGTWMLSVKVNNAKIWERVKADDVRGFSIEGFFVDQVVSAQAVDLTSQCKNCPKDEKVMDELKAIIMEELDPAFEMSDIPLFRTANEAQLYGQMFLNCDDSHELDVLGVTLHKPCKE